MTKGCSIVNSEEPWKLQPNSIYVATVALSRQCVRTCMCAHILYMLLIHSAESTCVLILMKTLLMLMQKGGSK